MRVEMWVSSPEPAVEVFTSAGTWQGRFQRHFVIGYADPCQNPPAVRSAAAGFGEGSGQSRALSRRRGDLGHGEQDQRLTATVTATAAANGRRQLSATADNARTIRANLGYVRPVRKLCETGLARGSAGGAGY
jgi:hypothetical protein